MLLKLSSDEQIASLLSCQTFTHKDKDAAESSKS